MKEDFFAMIRRINAYCHLADDKGTKPAKRVRKKRKKLDLAGVTPNQAKTLLILARGEGVPVGEFRVYKTDLGWSTVNEDGDVRNVNVDASQCSCEDSRFRQRVCKHMEAVLCVCRVT